MNATGAIVMSMMATVWCVAGIYHARPYPAWYGIPVLITAALIGVAARRHAAPAASTDESRRDRLVGMASTAEGILILVAVNVLRNTGRPDLASPVIALIVGLHFIPLARWLPARVYYATGLLIVATGLAGFAITDVGQRLSVVGIGAASALWLTSAFILFASPRGMAAVT